MVDVLNIILLPYYKPPAAAYVYSAIQLFSALVALHDLVIIQISPSYSDTSYESPHILGAKNVAVTF